MHHAPKLCVELDCFKQGRDIILAFTKDFGPALARVNDYDNAMVVSRAAEILRRQILECKASFEGSFEDSYMNACTPAKLLNFVSSVSHGTDIKAHMDVGASKPDVALAQLIQFNCFAKYDAAKYDATAMYQRHSKDREPAFPVFMELSVHSKTRKKEIVNTLFEHGLSINYDRVLEISAQMGEAVVKRYVDIGLVCPPQLRLGVFTVSAVDNCDHNPSASTAKTSFHGTSISLFQSESSGEPQNDLVLNRNVKKIPDLPESYTNVKPAYFPKKPIPPENELTEIPEPSKFHLEKE